MKKNIFIFMCLFQAYPLIAMQEETKDKKSFYTGLKPYDPKIHDCLTEVIAKKTNKLKFTVQYNYKGGLVINPNFKNWTKEKVRDQGSLGSCTANALAVCLEALNPSLKISRLYQYYHSLFEESRLYGMSPYQQMMYMKEDPGATLAGALIAADKYGSTPENVVMPSEKVNKIDISGSVSYKGYPYDISCFTFQPHPEAYRLAFDKDMDGINDGNEFNASNSVNVYPIVASSLYYKDLTSAYRANMSMLQKKDFINTVCGELTLGHSIYAGILLDDSFLNDDRGYILTPESSTFQATGGHAICIVGYGPFNDQKKQTNYFKFLNSWGPNWGDKGFGYLEEKYFTNIPKFGIEAYSISFMPFK